MADPNVCILSAETRNVLAQLAYDNWSNEHDSMKRVKAEIDDGSPDWPLMHTERFQNHTEALSKARRVLHQIQQYSTLMQAGL